MDMEVVFSGGKKVTALYKGYKVTTDHPKDAGGESTAPTPFDMFLVSIGSCAGYWVLAFCQERSIPTEEIRLGIRFERDEVLKLISKVHVEIQLPPEFPEKYRDAVVMAAQNCTVSRHLDNPPEIDIVAVPAV
jgi:ribosomal protein S12 methylthiotransferase accessory factor